MTQRQQGALDLFRELVAEKPAILEKRVAFDFPRDVAHVRSESQSAGLEVEHLWDGQVIFRYDTAEDVPEHLLKSGAGTAFYDAVERKRRKSLEREFVRTLASRQGSRTPYEVVHDYVSCIARKA